MSSQTGSGVGWGVAVGAGDGSAVGVPVGSTVDVGVGVGLGDPVAVGEGVSVGVGEGGGVVGVAVGSGDSKVGVGTTEVGAAAALTVSSPFSVVSGISVSPSPIKFASVRIRSVTPFALPRKIMVATGPSPLAGLAIGDSSR
jgi:hypothetical protein